MTPEDKAKITDLRERKYSIRRIARMLGVAITSVRYALGHEGMLERARKKRRDAGAVVYRCSKCGQLGHNRRTCGA